MHVYVAKIWFHTCDCTAVVLRSLWMRLQDAQQVECWQAFSSASQSLCPASWYLLILRGVDELSYQLPHSSNTSLTCSFSVFTFSVVFKMNENAHTHTHARTHERMHACMHTRIHSRTYSRTYSCTYQRVRTYALTHTHARMHLNTHLHMHPHTHLRTHPLIMNPFMRPTIIIIQSLIHALIRSLVH